MRYVIRNYFIYVLSLGLLSRISNFVHVENEAVLLVAAAALLILNVFLKPFLKIVMLPINIVTLGLFAWAIHVLVIYAATMIVPGFTLSAADFPAVRVAIFLFPAMKFSIFWTYLLFALLLTTTARFIDWVLTRQD